MKPVPCRLLLVQRETEADAALRRLLLAPHPTEAAVVAPRLPPPPHQMYAAAGALPGLELAQQHTSAAVVPQRLLAWHRIDIAAGVTYVPQAVLPRQQVLMTAQSARATEVPGASRSLSGWLAAQSSFARPGLPRSLRAQG